MGKHAGVRLVYHAIVLQCSMTATDSCVAIVQQPSHYTRGGCGKIDREYKHLRSLDIAAETPLICVAELPMVLVTDS